MYPNVGAAGCVLVEAGGVLGLRPRRGSWVYPNVVAAGCTVTSGQLGAAWSGQEVCSGFALAARCMNSYYTIRIKKCMNWYKNCTVYEFIMNNLYNNFCMNSYKN